MSTGASMDSVMRELMKLSQEAFERLVNRLEGLSDEEYLWKPAAEVWTLGPGEDGRLEMEWGIVFDEVPPVTTIAWRLTHIIDLLSEERCATWIGLTPEPENLFADGAPATAAAAREMLDAANERWRRYLSAADTDALHEPLGPIARQFADATRHGFVLHIIDELIHHAAEVGLLRDLYRAERDAPDEVRGVLLSGDLEAIGRLSEAQLDAARAAHPDLVLAACELARWDAIEPLLDRGFGIDGRDGRTPLHHAAAEGRVGSMRLLLDRGADRSARDPVYQATPEEWARFFGRTEAIDLLGA